MGSEARRRIHFLQFSPPQFHLCFPTAFPRDHGKVKVVLQDGAVKIEREVSVQPQFFQAKHYYS